MEARELRIGNKISYYNKIYDVVQIGLNGVLATSIEGQCSAIITHPMLKPIPLTDEWLLTNGFEVYKHLSDENYKSIGIVGRFKDFEYPNGITITLKKYSKDMCEFECQYVPKLEGRYITNIHDLLSIKYVHELQNLYFALTGNELEIKM